MSLVPTYVQSTSGKWYKNPVIRGEDGTWFVCWDDDEPIELVIAEDGPEPEGVVNRLRGEGWDVHLGRQHQKPIQQGGRLFAVMLKGAPVYHRQGDRSVPMTKFRPTKGAWWLRQRRGPSDLLLEGHEPLEEYRADCVIYRDGPASA